MDNLTNLIKAEIHRQYGSVAKFSAASGIPYGTLGNALAKGVGGTAYDTVVKICNMLHIQQAHDNELILFNKDFHDIYQKLTELDSIGVHTVVSVLNVEHMRCTKTSDPEVKGFNGIGYLVSTAANDENRIRKLVKSVKKNG